MCPHFLLHIPNEAHILDVTHDFQLALQLVPCFIIYYGLSIAQVKQN